MYVMFVFALYTFLNLYSVFWNKKTANAPTVVVSLTSRIDFIYLFDTSNYVPFPMFRFVLFFARIIAIQNWPNSIRAGLITYDDSVTTHLDLDSSESMTKNEIINNYLDISNARDYYNRMANSANLIDGIIEAIEMFNTQSNVLSHKILFVFWSTNPNDESINSISSSQIDGDNNIPTPRPTINGRGIRSGSASNGSNRRRRNLLQTNGNISSVCDLSDDLTNEEIETWILNYDIDSGDGTISDELSCLGSNDTNITSIINKLFDTNETESITSTNDTATIEDLVETIFDDELSQISDQFEGRYSENVTYSPTMMPTISETEDKCCHARDKTNLYEFDCNEYEYINECLKRRKHIKCKWDLFEADICPPIIKIVLVTNSSITLEESESEESDSNECNCIASIASNSERSRQDEVCSSISNENDCYESDRNRIGVCEWSCE